MKDRHVLVKRGGALAAVFLASVLLLGCGGSSKKADAPTSSTAPSAAGNPAVDSQTADHFWQTIVAIDVLAATTPGRDKATALAQQVCASINPSMSTKQAQDAATAVLNAAGVRATAVPYWAGAASAAFCPQYSKLLTG